MTTQTTKRRGYPDFNRRFNLGDLVTVNGYANVIYRIISYFETREVTKDAEFLDVEYTLENVDDDNDWNGAYDEDCTLVARKDDAERFLRNRQARERRKVRSKRTVDDLLDEYNDKMALYVITGDIADKRKAERVLDRLRKMTGGVVK